MKRILVFSVLVIALTITAFAQAPDTLWTRTYGGSGNEWGNSVCQTNDGGFIVTGTTYVSGSGYDMLLIKTDANGDTLWTLQDYYEGNCVQQTSDGCYIVTGHSDLIKINSSGNEIWHRTPSGDLEEGNSVWQTDDGGYIITGLASIGTNGELCLVKTDNSGNGLWTRIFGGSSVERGHCVQQTYDGGYIIIGHTNSFGAGSSDLWLIKTDNNGFEQWNRTFGGVQSDYGRSVEQTADGGYILVGHTSSYGAGGDDVWLIKTNADGNTIWTQTFGGGLNDAGRSVQQTSDGGFIIVGETESFGAYYSSDVWIIKTDSLGNGQWHKILGGGYHDAGYSIKKNI